MLIVDDPDAPDPRAPKMTLVHWVLANVPGGLVHPPKAQVEAAMKGHVLAHTQLVGTYETTGR